MGVFELGNIGVWAILVFGNVGLVEYSCWRIEVLGYSSTFRIECALLTGEIQLNS